MFYIVTVILMLIVASAIVTARQKRERAYWDAEQESVRKAWEEKQYHENRHRLCKDIKMYAGPLLALTEPLTEMRKQYYEQLAMERDPILAAELRGMIFALGRLLQCSEQSQRAVAMAEEAEKQAVAKSQKGEQETNASRRRAEYKSYGKRADA